MMLSTQSNAFFSAKKPMICYLSIFAKGFEYLPYLLLVFERMGRFGLGPNRTHFDLDQVLYYSSTNQDWQVLDQKSPPTEVNMRLKIQNNAPEDKVTVCFYTPSTIVSNNKVSYYIHFQELIRALLRRISMLSVVHDNQTLDLDFENLKKGSDDIKILHSDLKLESLERYSRKQSKKLYMRGMTGNITYQGNLQPYIELLNLGQWTGVGKHTMFGFGKYIIESDERNNILDEMKLYTSITPSTF